MYMYVYYYERTAFLALSLSFSLGEEQKSLLRGRHLVLVQRGQQAGRSGGEDWCVW